HWPHDEQRRGILRTHRGARLLAIASHSRVTHRERFGTAGETYARRVQSEERRFESALRAREKNVAVVRVISYRPHLSPTKQGSRCTRERSDGRSLRKIFFACTVVRVVFISHCRTQKTKSPLLQRPAATCRAARSS